MSLSEFDIFEPGTLNFPTGDGPAFLENFDFVNSLSPANVSQSVAIAEATNFTDSFKTAFAGLPLVAPPVSGPVSPAFSSGGAIGRFSSTLNDLIGGTGSFSNVDVAGTQANGLIAATELPRINVVKQAAPFNWNPLGTALSQLNPYGFFPQKPKNAEQSADYSGLLIVGAIALVAILVLSGGKKK